MTSRKAKSVKELKSAIDEWRIKHPQMDLELAAIFKTDRRLFLELARAEMSRAERREYPDLSNLVELAGATLRFTRKPVRKAYFVGKNKLERPLRAYFEEANASLKRGKMPTGKTWLFHGIPFQQKIIERYKPELRKEYRVVLDCLKTGPTTRAELKEKTGIASSDLESILRRLKKARMIKTKKHKRRARSLFLSAHC